jgi:acyl-CoA synthetase (AMP-forming)/AMP-acid ligase II
MFSEVVREAARRFADSPAFVREDGEALSYADLDRLSDETAAGLALLGLGPGDVIALVMRSGPAYVVSYAACAKVGAITAGVNERLSPPEQAACLAVADPDLVITDDGGAEAIQLAMARKSLSLAGVDSGAAVRDLFEFRVLGADASSLPPLPEDPDRPVAIVFTSGTTGLPKGAVFCESQLDAIGETDGGRRWGAGGRGLGSTSMAHLGTMTKLPQVLRNGGTTFLMGRWSPGRALEMIERHKITTLGGIPTQVALMMRHELFEKTDLSSVRLIALGGGPSAPSLVREARERFGVPVVVRYTCTEAGVGTGTAIDDPPEDAEETVGTARGEIELSIRLFGEDGSGSGSGSGSADFASGELLETGEIGEVCLRSPAVMACYYRDPNATAAVLASDGAVRTGDLGWVDDRGRLHLCGRAKEMYVRGGYNVFPLEVEAVLSEHPALAHVAVASRPDPVMGEIGVAVIVVRPGADPPALADLRRHAEGVLAHHKLPEDLVVVDELPRTAMEKVDRRVLQRLVDPSRPS